MKNIEVEKEFEMVDFHLSIVVSVCVSFDGKIIFTCAHPEMATTLLKSTPQTRNLSRIMSKAFTHIRVGTTTTCGSSFF